MVTATLVASCLVKKDGKFLLVKAKVGMPKGLWNLPGGHLDEDETFDSAAIRETKEETGLDVSLGKILCIGHQRIDNEVVVVVFPSSSCRGKLKIPKNEIEDARWFSAQEIDNMKKK